MVSVTDNTSLASLRGLAASLSAILLLLAMTACGFFGGPPKTPANQRYGYELTGSAMVKWDASADADSYTVYYDGSFDSGCKLSSGEPNLCEELATNLTDTRYTDYRIHTDTKYYWVVACNSSGCSEIYSANPALPPPSSPENVRTAQEGSSIRISWNPVPVADYYKVFSGSEEVDGNVVETAYAHNPRPIVTPLAVKVVDRGFDSLTVEWRVVEGIHYYNFSVAACNSAGCSKNDNRARVQYSTQLHYQLHRRSQEG